MLYHLSYELLLLQSYHSKPVSSPDSRTRNPIELVRPRVVGSDAYELQSSWRKYPVEFDGTGDWRDSFSIKIPPGYTVEDLPDPTNIDTSFASYHSDVKADGDILHYSREYTVKKLELSAADYGQLRDFESKIYTDENRDAVLKKTN